MKTSADPRHKERQKILKSLFAQGFTDQPIPQKAKKVLKKGKILDKEIKSVAPIWPIEKLNRIDLAILRLAVYELKYESTPPKVIIDEAVELAKEFGGENSASFVNGVLGTFYENQKKKNE